MPEATTRGWTLFFSVAVATRTMFCQVSFYGTLQRPDASAFILRFSYRALALCDPRSGDNEIE